MSLTRSPEIAEELSAEAFLRVLRALRGQRGPTDAFGGYVAATIRNLYFDQQRRDRDARVRVVHNDLVARDDAAEALDGVEERAMVLAALATLPERWRTVLWLVEVEERPLFELADELGMTPNAVAALAYRARRGLREAWLRQLRIRARGVLAALAIGVSLLVLAAPDDAEWAPSGDVLRHLRAAVTER
jgi:RNA polymerase sigma factor (sigma-70 family)